MSKKEIIFITLGLVAIGILGRLLPHPWNMTPIAGVALFASAYLGARASFVVFLSTMVLTDLIIGTYNPLIMLSVYGSFALTIYLGKFLREKRGVLRIAGLSISASLLFFVFTNTAVWLWSGMYQLTLEGLILCFTLALPFFANQMLGDLIYSGALFGSYELYAKKSQMKERISQRVISQNG